MYLQDRKRKQGSGCNDDGCTKHYSDSQFRSVRVYRNKTRWTPDDVVQRGKDMIKTIVLKLEEIRND